MPKVTLKLMETGKVKQKGIKKVTLTDWQKER